MEDLLTTDTSFGKELGKQFALALATSAGTMAAFAIAGYTYSKYLDWKNSKDEKTTSK